MFSTRFTSSTRLTGFDRKSSVPASTEFAKRRDHQDHDRARGGIRLQPLADLEAGKLRHHHVEQEDVGLERRYLLERVGTVDGGGHLAVEVGEIDLKQLAIRLVVVGDQHAGLADVGGGGLGLGHREPGR